MVCRDMKRLAQSQLQMRGRDSQARCFPSRTTSDRARPWHGWMPASLRNWRPALGWSGPASLGSAGQEGLAVQREHGPALREGVSELCGNQVHPQPVSTLWSRAIPRHRVIRPARTCMPVPSEHCGECSAVQPSSAAKLGVRHASVPRASDTRRGSHSASPPAECVGAASGGVAASHAAVSPKRRGVAQARPDARSHVPSLRRHHCVASPRAEHVPHSESRRSHTKARVGRTPPTRAVFDSVVPLTNDPRSSTLHPPHPLPDLATVARATEWPSPSGYHALGCACVPGQTRTHGGQAEQGRDQGRSGSRRMDLCARGRVLVGTSKI